MNGFSLSTLMSCAAFCAVMVSTANSQPNDEWNGKPRIFGVNTLTPHVTSMPYSTVEEAIKGDRHASEWYQTLSGTWKFFHVEKPSQRNNDFYKDNYDVSGVGRSSGRRLPGSCTAMTPDFITNVVYSVGGRTIGSSAPGGSDRVQPGRPLPQHFHCSRKVGWQAYPRPL
jgi:hypothetical protein